MIETPTNRDELHDLLVEVLGSSNVYYNPPESVKMKYPAIVYHKEKIKSEFAEGAIYKKTYTYSVTLIEQNPDSDAVDRMLQLPYCKHDRSYTVNGMYHDVFIIKY